MTKAKLAALCHKISKETGVSFNSVLLYYFLENVLKKISKSKYNEKFIFKGGFLLSNVLGIESRSTMDIDYLYNNLLVSEEQVARMLRESLITNDDDEILYEITDIMPIKTGELYGGYRVRILCKFDNLRQVVPLDIASGDIITPHPIMYSFHSLFEDEEILIKAYPMESMLAEKLQTIYAKGFLNSRSKDFYDLYLLYRLKSKEMVIQTLIHACERTFHHRETEFDVKKIQDLLQKLKHDDTFINRWKAYAMKNTYVQGIEFDEVIVAIIKLTNLLKV